MTATILLDTCAVIWIMEDKPLAPAAIEAIDAAGHQGLPLMVSPITGWELGLAFSLGRLRSPLHLEEYLRRVHAIPGLKAAPLTAEILLRSSFLPGRVHKDPADRIIAATAREFGYTVMTRDRALLDYAAEGHLRAVEC